MNNTAKRETEILTVDNVQFIGERIATCAVRGYARLSGNDKMHKLYASLCRDIDYKDREGYILTDGYDLVQEAICFLLEHLGERLCDKTCKGWRGDVITVKTACYRHLGRYLQRGARADDKNLSLEAFEYNEPHTYFKAFENDMEEAYKEVDKTIENMKLSPEERDTLYCYMSGMGYVETAKHLAVQLTTIWYRRKRIQQKYCTYMAAINSIVFNCTTGGD